MVGEKKGILSFLRLDGLLDHLTAYIDAKIEIFKLGVEEKAAGVIFKVVIGVALFCLCWFFIMFLSLALGFYFGAVLDNVFYGFLIIAGFYLLLFILLLLLKDRLGLKEFIENKMPQN